MTAPDESTTQAIHQTIKLDRLRQILDSSTVAVRRYARRMAFAVATFTAVIVLVPLEVLAISDTHEIWPYLIGNILVWLFSYYPVYALIVRDVRQMGKLVAEGEQRPGRLVGVGRFVATAPKPSPRNMKFEWEEDGRMIWAIANDAADPINETVRRDVLVLTRGRKRWVGVVVGDRLLVGRRQPREYHLFGKSE